MVGVDGSHGSSNALLWALDEARARKIAVHVVLAWQSHRSQDSLGLGSMFPLDYNPPPGNAEPDPAASADTLLDAIIGKAIESDSDTTSDPVRITRHTVQGHAAEVLLGIVTGSDLMVIGSHGHGGFVGALLGSISHHVVSHSRCPVVVVPAPQRTAQD